KRTSVSVIRSLKGSDILSKSILMTTIYYTLCKQLPQTEYKKLVSLLPEIMQQRIGEYRRWQDAHSYLYGRLLFKEGMLRLGYNISLESMKKTKYGKPYFTDNSFTFNIS